MLLEAKRGCNGFDLWIDARLSARGRGVQLDERPPARDLRDPLQLPRVLRHAQLHRKPAPASARPSGRLHADRLRSVLGCLQIAIIVESYLFTKRRLEDEVRHIPPPPLLTGFSQFARWLSSARVLGFGV